MYVLERTESLQTFSDTKLNFWCCVMIHLHNLVEKNVFLVDMLSIVAKLCNLMTVVENCVNYLFSAKTVCENLKNIASWVLLIIWAETPRYSFTLSSAGITRKKSFAELSISKLIISLSFGFFLVFWWFFYTHFIECFASVGLGLPSRGGVFEHGTLLWKGCHNANL